MINVENGFHKNAFDKIHSGFEKGEWAELEDGNYYITMGEYGTLADKSGVKLDKESKTKWYISRQKPYPHADYYDYKISTSDASGEVLQWHNDEPRYLFNWNEQVGFPIKNYPILSAKRHKGLLNNWTSLVDGNPSYDYTIHKHSFGEYSIEIWIQGKYINITFYIFMSFMP